MISRYSKEDLAAFEDRASQGFIRQVIENDLILYNYTDKCTYERAWDEYTMVSRGLVVNRWTGDIVARPFSKFFNLNEVEATRLENLPLAQGYHAFDKLDGSLGICYWHNGGWHMNTRGSFDSDQAIVGRKLLNDYQIYYLDKDFTYLFEIIYPDNKIVVDYGFQDKLVLLGCVHTKSGREVHPEVLGYVADQLGMESAQLFPFDITEIIALQKTLPKDQEGFVVRFANGLRVKIKGEEYMRIARIISHMTPLLFWDTMVEGMVNRQHLASLPEEYRGEYEPIVRDLEKNYNVIQTEILEDLQKLPTRDISKFGGRKTVGLFLQNNSVIKHKGAMWPLLDKKYGVVDEYIKKKIRPWGNVMRDDQ
jgi:RNA ligase